MRAVVAGTVLFAVGLGIFELAMSPSGDERMGVALILAVMATGTVGAALLVTRGNRALLSLRHTLVGLSILSFAIVAIGLTVAGQQMFISGHDLSLLLVFLGFGLASAVVFGVLVSGPLTSDLQLISETARSIADGELSVRTGVRRGDEVGALGEAIDDMAMALEDARQQRERDEASRREFLASVGHDLRTPLASLRAALEAVQDGLVGPTERFLRIMESDVSALSGLVDDIEELANIESPHRHFEPEVIDLTEIADDALSTFLPLAANKEVSLRLDAGERVMASAGAREIGRVVRNLVDNAIRHSPRGGRVVVSVSNGPAATVDITDDGPGFAHDYVEHAFDRFSRGDESRDRSTGGAGLGLAIAKGYVDAFGGDIAAVAGPPGRVRFTLPAASGEVI